MGTRASEVFLENRSGVRVPSSALTSFAAEVRRALKLKGGVAVLICRDREIREMNRWFRGKDRPTDVLSFPSDIVGHAGDLAISGEMAAANARKLRLSRTEEIKILILHGMLHLAGYDHEVDDGQMSARESVLRKRFGLSQSLIQRTEASAQRVRSRGTR